VRDIYVKIHKLAVQFQENLRQYLEQNPDQYQRMESVDRSSFEHYTESQGYDFSQDAEDIADDFQQPGALGVGITDDDGSILGYVYGYNMTMDEMPPADAGISNDDLTEQFGVRLYINVSENFAENLATMIRSGKIFYISNLALPSHKIQLYKMIKKLIKKLRASGYEYVTFDALSDSLRLFMGKDLTPKASRLALFGVKLIAAIPDEDNWEHTQVLFQI
jgi:hypothetical protein